MLFRSQAIVLNFASGQEAGGGFKWGAAPQEEELCRTFPGLYGSLEEAQRAQLYPFGPPAGNYDVLVTRDVQCRRWGAERNYSFMPEEEWFSAHIISAAAPRRHDPNDDDAAYLPILKNVLETAREMRADQPTALILGDRKSTRLNSSHSQQSRMPSSA